MAAAGSEPAGNPVRLVGLLPRLEIAVRFVDLLHRHDTVELVRERVDALGAKALELGPAIVLALRHGRDSMKRLDRRLSRAKTEDGKDAGSKAYESTPRHEDAASRRFAAG